MDIFKSLEADESTLNNAREQVKDLEAKRDALIAKKVAEINKEYATSINDWDKKAKSQEAEIKGKIKQIQHFSSFDAHLLGEAIRSLMEYVEGKEYVFSEVEHKYLYPRMRSDRVRMIIQKDKYKNSFTSHSKLMSKIDDVVSQGYAVVLSENGFYHWDCGFVHIHDSKNNKLVCNIKFGTFDYVQEFIKLLIQYRIDNGLLAFSRSEMLKFLQLFALEYQSVLKAKQKELPSDRVLSFTYHECN